MTKYIDAEVLKSRLEDFSRWCKDGRKEGVDFVLDCPLPDIPTADVQEVKHAKNLQKCFKWSFECSLCHWCDDDTYCADTSEFKFCPNCGAKIDNDDFCSRGERRKEDVDA